MNIKEELYKLDNLINNLNLQKNNVLEKEIDKIKMSIKKNFEKIL